MLYAENLVVNYGKITALKGVSVKVEQGETVAIIGSNGAGKSTLLNAISGVIKPREGSITFQGKRIDGKPTYKLAKMGLASVPSGQHVFPEMTVRENLEMGAFLCRDKKLINERMEEIHSLFPVLLEKHKLLAHGLSGGQKQMLCMGRGLMSGSKMILLDEPTQGLAPLLVKHLRELIIKINKEYAITILVVEQNARMALSVADRAYVLHLGECILEGEAARVSESELVKKAYLGM
jgi:branched-chain amino acid transport system ATP-binding protein